MRINENWIRLLAECLGSKQEPLFSLLYPQLASSPCAPTPTALRVSGQNAGLGTALVHVHLSQPLLPHLTVPGIPKDRKKTEITTNYSTYQTR